MPLLGGRVNTGGVVGASVEEDDGAWLGVGEVTAHAIKVKTTGLGVIVGIVTDFETSSLEDLVVVSPSRLGDVDGCLAELGEEVSQDLEGAGTRESLAGSNTPRVNVGVVPAEGHHL